VSKAEFDDRLAEERLGAVTRPVVGCSSSASRNAVQALGGWRSPSREDRSPLSSSQKRACRVLCAFSGRVEAFVDLCPSVSDLPEASLNDLPSSATSINLLAVPRALDETRTAHGILPLGGAILRNGGPYLSKTASIVRAHGLALGRCGRRLSPRRRGLPQPASLRSSSSSVGA